MGNGCPWPDCDMYQETDPASFANDQAEADALAITLLSRDADQLSREVAGWSGLFRRALQSVERFRFALDNGMDEYVAIERLLDDFGRLQVDQNSV